MAIALDTSTKSGSAGATSLTWAHTCTGSNLVLIVVAAESNGTVPTATYNAVSMTSIGGTTQDGGVMRTFYLIAPATGANNVVVTWSTGGAKAAAAASYTGCDQVSQPDSSNTGTSINNALTVSTTVVVSNSWLVGGFAVTSPQTFSAGASTTLRQNQSNDPATAALMDSNGTVDSGSRSLAVTWTGPAGNTGGGLVLSLDPFVVNNTLVMAQGAFTLTGFAMLFGHLITLVQGAFSLTGQAVTFALDLFWDNQSKSSTTTTNGTKNSTSYSNLTKNTSTFNNQTRN